MESKDYKNEIDLRRFSRELRRHKWLYIGIAALILAAVIVYVARKESVYTAHSELLIEDSSNDSQSRGGSLMQMMRVFSMGGFNSSSVDNELLLVNTYDVALRTVRTLDLNVNCMRSDGLSKTTMWRNSPVALTLPEGEADILSRGFNVKVTLNGENSADIRAYSGRIFSTTLAEKKNAQLPCTVTTPRGTFTVGLTGLPAKSGETYIFAVTGYAQATATLAENVKCDVSNKLADGIEFEYTSQNRLKVQDVLNTMMAEYNAKRLDRKRETAITELNFITERIDKLYTDIVDTEKQVEKFKTESNFVDIEAEAPILLETTLGAHEELIKASAQMVYYEQVLDILQKGGDGMLPTIAAPGTESSSKSSSMIADYNEQMALLMELRRSAKPGNNARSAAEERVKQMRASIVSSVSQLLEASRKVIASRSGTVGTMDSHLRKLPKYEREYINLSRDQLLKNELYAFLVEKRENALMKLNSQDTLGFIIDPAYVDPKPSLTKVIIILAAGLLLALLIPAAIASLMLRRKDTVDNPCDLRSLGLEGRAVETSCDGDNISAARNIIIRSGKVDTLYIADLASGDCGKKIVTELTTSLERSGAATTLAEPKSGFNDGYLSPAWLADRPQNGSYRLAPLPQPERVKDIAPAINAEGGALLIVLRRGEMLRRRLDSMLGDINRAKVIVIIAEQ